MSIDAFPKVIVVTLNYNQVAYSKDCIESLLKSTYLNYQLLLVDNGSTSENFLEINKLFENEPLINIVRLYENQGYVGGINHGMKLAYDMGADYILVMNNDTIIDQDAISSLVECAERYNEKAIVSGKVYNYDERDTLQYIGQDFDPDGMLNQRSIVKGRREKDVGQYDEEREMGMLDDIFWLIPKSLYEKLGSYSDYFYLYGEQNDYGFRALKEGYKFVYTPNAKIWHKGGITTCGGEKKSAKIEYWTTFAVFKLAVLHFPESKSKPFIKKWFIRQLIKNIILFLSGKTKLDNVQSTYLAYKHFRHWNLVRYKDNGFNPFA
ncbi:glycosyltransferase family 2 protein [Vibrio vulnificus]|nr:glycosyltransferase family 2 protein [Vibrio vulnificus]EID4337909.1 glycosyltransferase family 2 protein [Vibrio vulnificus]MCU8295527.1 glycosyltransferase family 2 protein [Vibrio vulnificus]MCU8416033.1 glycosyltransferase family 2 protein [Vibrio vulnificus]HAS8147141.1 glycosyltransferase family 2 protein [Vibrio vulnificus]